MVPTMRNPNATHDGFALWRLVTWLILLLSVYGCLTYAAHGMEVWKVMRVVPSENAEGIAVLRGYMAWDVAYFIAAFALVVICTCAILWRSWARPALQVASALLAFMAVAGGVSQAVKWHDFNQQVKATEAQTSLDTASQLALTHLHHSVLMALGIRVVAVPVLLWLAWWLGRPQVRSQFGR